MENTHGPLLARRKGGRFEPRNSVTVAFHRGAAPFTYGVVSNISVTGACVVTAFPLPENTDLYLKLSFYRQPEIFEVKSKILWSRASSSVEKEKKELQGLIFHGTQFMEFPKGLKTRLTQLLETAEFHPIVAPELISPEMPEMDVDQQLMDELRKELNQLGNKFRETSGN